VVLFELGLIENKVVGRKIIDLSDRTKVKFVMIRKLMEVLKNLNYTVGKK
jgi:hypothetical protein